MLIYVLLLAVISLFLLRSPAYACTTVIIGKDVSPTGRIIVGHNEDDGGRLINRHGYVPASDHTTDEIIPAEKGYAAIPQIAHTHGFYWSEVKGAEGGLATADSFYNDCGVLLVSNSCVHSKESDENMDRLTDGGIGFNLRRITAERATSARDAVEIIASLVEKWGYVSSGRSYTVADASEAWMVQVVSGRHFAAQRVGDDEVAFMPNNYTIHSIDPENTGKFRISDNLIGYAIEKGWYDPERDGEFDFARVYQKTEDWMRPGNTYRSAAAYSILTRSPFWRNGNEGYPFSVKVDGKISCRQIMEILRTHYEDTFLDPDWERTCFSGGSPHDTDIRRICTATTVEASVTILGERPALTTMWLCFGRPCELPFVPIHPYFGVPALFDDMRDKAPEILAEHCTVDGPLMSWKNDCPQLFRDFQHEFELVYERHSQSHLKRLFNFENILAVREQQVHGRAQELYGEKKDQEAAELLRNADEKAAKSTADMIHRCLHLLSTQELKVSPSALPMNSTEEVTVTFSLTGDSALINEETLQIVLGGTRFSKLGIRPVEKSLTINGSTGSFRIKAGDLQKLNLPGTFEYLVGARDIDANPLSGKFFFTFTE